MGSFHFGSMFCMKMLIPLFLILFAVSNPAVCNTALFDCLPIGKIELLEFKCADGGASNQNYFIITKKERLFLRIGRDEETLSNEATIAKLVSEMNLAPKVISYSSEQNLLATRMITDLQAFDLHNEATLEELALLIKQMHDSPIQFPVTQSPREMTKALLDEVRAESITLPESFETRLAILCDGLIDSTTSPCHLDLHRGNLLHDASRFWIIDWEYACNSDPLFDLAVLCSTESFTDEEMARLLEFYGQPEALEPFLRLRALADARWALWCLLQNKRSSLDFPYESEANRYFKAFFSRNFI